MEAQIRSFLLTENIVPEIQSGFRTNHSGTIALLNVSDDMIQAIDHNKMTALILVDFRKAFDTITHSLPIEILSSCSVLGPILMTIYTSRFVSFVRNSYLRRRYSVILFISILLILIS